MVVVRSAGSTLPRGTDSLDAANGCCGRDTRLGLGSADVTVSEADRDADDVADADRYMGERVADDAHVALARSDEAICYGGYLWRVWVRRVGDRNIWIIEQFQQSLQRDLDSALELAELPEGRAGVDFGDPVAALPEAGMGGHAGWSPDGLDRGQG
jgi:hypothetical protein